jgi:hypothetical protein
MSKTKDLLTVLAQERIGTWFDLGNFIDKLRLFARGGENFNYQVEKNKHQSHEGFLRGLSQGIAFLSFYFKVDGVTIELKKYADILNSILPGAKIHWIAGHIDSDFSAPGLIYKIEDLESFEDWELYNMMFFADLERGTDGYNTLPRMIWDETLRLVDQLGSYLERKRIQCIIPANIDSNPGNVSLTLATIIVSEFFRIPVISSNHDYYWEGGVRKEERKIGENGPRDHFFRNADVGEFFSIIQSLFPWNSRLWVQANITKMQTEKLISQVGINPLNTVEIPTSVDLQRKNTRFDDIRKNAVHRVDELLHSAQQVDDAKISSLVLDSIDSPLLFTSNPNHKLDSVRNSFVILQPTRIIDRKRIEKGFDITDALCDSRRFVKYMEQNGKKEIIFIIAGPIAVGHVRYFEFLLHKWSAFKKALTPEWRVHIHLYCAFGANEKDINSLYIATDVVSFFSELETRGLPIIESAAVGVPILVGPNKAPLGVYDEVIGKNLPKEQLLTIEANNKKPKTIANELLNLISDKRSLYSWRSANFEATTNRFSKEVLRFSFESVMEKIWLLQQPYDLEEKLSRGVLRKLHRDDDRGEPLQQEVLYANNRQYLPGYSTLAFLQYLKSLIDPTYFRIEEAELRSRIFSFAQTLVDSVSMPTIKRHMYFTAVDKLFDVKDGSDDKIIVDHSFNYRYRNNDHYMYRDLTEQELEGAVVMLSRDIFGDDYDPLRLSGLKMNCNEHAMMFVNKWSRRLSQNWNDASRALSCASVFKYHSISGKDGDFGITFEELERKYIQVYRQKLAIDNTDYFIRDIVSQPQHLVLLPGGMGEFIIELFVIGEIILSQWMKSIIGKKRSNIMHEGELERALEHYEAFPFSLSIFVREKPFLSDICSTDIDWILQQKEFSRVRRLAEKGVIRFIRSSSDTSGTNLRRLGKEDLEVLKKVKQHQGYLLVSGEHHDATLDYVYLPSYRFGQARRLFASKMLGIPQGSFFFRLVPPGVRTTMTYPVTTQDAVSLAKILRSREFTTFQMKFGGDRDKAFEALTDALDLSSTTYRKAINSFAAHYAKSPVTFRDIAGLYRDGFPWTGTLARVNRADAQKDKHKLNFTIISPPQPETLEAMVQSYKDKKRREVIIGWNGGYTLNTELVGKLGLSEEYIGVPLGLVIRNGKITSLPLFNKPSLGITRKGGFVIGRCSLELGGRAFLVKGKYNKLLCEWNKININAQNNEKDVKIYNGSYNSEIIDGTKRIVMFVISDRVHSVWLHDAKIPFIPVGIYISLPLANAYKFAQTIKPGYKMRFELNFSDEWLEVEEAIEAGPKLVENGRLALDMQREGWTHQNSIKTQAARLDRINQRGPKIAVGIDEQGDLLAVAINGRIRDSVGCTYEELAKIMIDRGVQQALGFDPGGSATLFVHGKVRNISPYNSDFNDSIYCSDPEPRAVANAVLGYIK